MDRSYGGPSNSQAVFAIEINDLDCNKGHTFVVPMQIVYMYMYLYMGI